MGNKNIAQIFTWWQVLKYKFAHEPAFNPMPFSMAMSTTILHRRIIYLTCPLEPQEMYQRPIWLENSCESYRLITIKICYVYKKLPLSISGPEVSAADSPPPQYSIETLVMAVVAGALSALFVGFVTGYLCGKKCRKDEDDNLPYPDTEYEYFEQRQNVNRYVLIRNF